MITNIFKAVFAIAVAAFITFPYTARAQQPANLPDAPVDAATKSAVIDTLLRDLNNAYVFAEVAKKMESDIRSRAARNEYDGVTTARKFAEKLTEDLQSVSKDKHLRVRFSPDKIPARTERSEPTAEERSRAHSFNKSVNFGFEKIERLDGNIGYIDLRSFNDPEAGADTVAAAMTLVSNTDALIFDLRRNGGGDPAMVALISSYLFGDKPVHLNDLYWRAEDKTEEFWTKAAVAGKKFGDKDVYVLTAKRTFSGAEEFSYNLKNLKRATIIGETTGGGAHPGSMVRLSDHFGAFIPTGRAISPITKTNWEGTGVEPDIKVPADQALKTAYIMALEKSIAKTNNERTRSVLTELAARNKKELEEIKAKGGK